MCGRAVECLLTSCVSVAVRVEKQGQGNRVHVTRETADLLEADGMGRWLVAREKSEAGKSFWLNTKSTSIAATPDDESENSDDSFHTEVHDDNLSHVSEDTGHTATSSVCTLDSKKNWSMQDILTAKEQRLIEWTVDQLATMLQKIVARRQAVQRYEEKKGIFSKSSDEQPPVLRFAPSDPTKTVLDEVQEMVEIPRYKHSLLLEDGLHGSEEPVLPDRVQEELTNFVSTVTTFYYDPARNPFHNFTHASHVLMSVVKMMQRIISPSQLAMEKDKKQAKNRRRRRQMARRSVSWEELHDHTYGKD